MVCTEIYRGRSKVRLRKLLKGGQLCSNTVLLSFSKLTMTKSHPVCSALARSDLPNLERSPRTKFTKPVNWSAKEIKARLSLLQVCRSTAAIWKQLFSPIFAPRNSLSTKQHEAARPIDFWWYSSNLPDLTPNLTVSIKEVSQKQWNQ